MEYALRHLQQLLSASGADMLQHVYVLCFFLRVVSGTLPAATGPPPLEHIPLHCAAPIIDKAGDWSGEHPHP